MDQRGTEKVRSFARSRQGWKVYLLRLACGLCLLVAAGVRAIEPLAPLVPEPSFFVRSWTVDDGTPLNTVMGAVRRRDGYLWVITRAGLFRFDGVKYRSVLQLAADSLPGVVTPALFEDLSKRLWLAKDNGVIACVDGTTVTVFTMKDGLPALKPRSLAGDGEGAVWISYWETSTLFRIKAGKVESFGGISGPAGNDRAMLSSDAQGQIWFACGQQVGVLRDNRMVPLLTHAQPVTSLTPAREGGVWFSDDRQVWKCREDGALEPLGPLPEGSVTILHEDRNGRLWVGTLAAGGGRLFRLEGREFRPVQVACPFIRSLSDDCEGNLWVGTRRTGLLQVRQRTVELMIPTADAPPRFGSFCEASEGRRFAVVNNRLLRFTQADGWAPLPTNRGQPDRNYFCVVADPAGGVWASARTKTSTQEQTELLRWRDNDLFSVSDTPLNSRSPIIRTLFVGSKGELWLGMQEDGELCRLREGQFKTFSVPPGNGTVCAMTEDAAGTVWAATVGGLLLRVNGESLVEHTPQFPGAPDPIRSLHATPDGSLWIGYETRGLGRLLQGHFFLFGQEQGLADEAVSQILSDNDGWLWCAGDRGIFRMKRDELEAMAAGKAKKLHPVLCGRGEGWPILQAACGNWPQAARSRSGELCMPTGAGLAIIRPGAVRDAPPPAVVLEHVSVNGRLVAAYESGKFPVRGQTASTTDLCGQTARLSLGQGVRQLGFDYTAISFTGQEHVRFRYRLEGVDDTWVEAGSQRAAYYSVLPPGHYCFRVSACNNAGIWNETGAALAFAVEPFWWETAWFRVAGPLVAAGLMLAGVILFLRRRYMFQIERLELLRATEKERSRIAADLHDEVGSSLTKIGRLAAKLDDAEISATARKVVQAMDEIVWTVNPRNDTLDSLAVYLVHYIEDFLRPAGIACEFDVALKGPDVPLSADVRHNLFLAVKEAVNNAVKHAAPRRVRLGLSLHGESLTLIVQDDGCGFVPGTPAAGADGLVNIRQRLAAIGGHVSIASVPGQGTTVTLQVALQRKEHT